MQLQIFCVRRVEERSWGAGPRGEGLASLSFSFPYSHPCKGSSFGVSPSPRPPFPSGRVEQPEEFGPGPAGGVRGLRGAAPGARL